MENDYLFPQKMGMKKENGKEFFISIENGNKKENGNQWFISTENGNIKRKWKTIDR